MAQSANENTSEFVGKTIAHIASLVSAVEKAQDMPQMQAYYLKAKAAGETRSLRTVLLDDLEELIGFTIMPLEDHLLPVALYKQFVALRNPDENLSDEDAREELRELREFTVEQLKQDGEFDPAPAFLHYVRESGDHALYGALGRLWGTTLYRLREAAIPGSVVTLGENLDTVSSLFQTWMKANLKETAPAVANSDQGVQANAIAQVPANNGGFNPDLLRAFKDAGAETLGNGAAGEVTADDADIEALMRILARKDTPYALLHSEQGVDRFSVIQGLIAKIGKGDVPETLDKAHFYKVDLTTLGLKGQMAPSILHQLLQAADAHNATHPEKVVLYFPHYTSNDLAVASAVAAMRSLIAIQQRNGSNLLMVAEASDQEIPEVQKQDKNALIAFHRLAVAQSDFDRSMRAIKPVAEKLADYHKIDISDELVEYAIKKTDRFMPTMKQPGKATSILEAAAARADVEGRKAMTTGDIERAIAEETNVPLAFVGGEMSDRIENLETELKKEVFGQDETIEEIASVIRLVNSGLHEQDKPLGVFFMSGPTGVGKTEIAKQLAKALFQDSSALIRVNMSEFSEKHTVSRILGSPPGYVGYGERTALEDVERRPFSVILLDEAEKAHPDVLKAMMTLMDEGRLGLLNGKNLDFRNCVVVLTSNLGALDAANAYEKAEREGWYSEEGSPDAMSRKAQKVAIERGLAPEIRNRMNMLQLNSLNEKVVAKIAVKKIAQISKRLNDNKLYANLSLKLSDEALQQLISVGYDKRLGARPMERAIIKYVQQPLGDWLREHQESIMKRDFELVIKGIKDAFAIETRSNKASSGKAKKKSAPAPKP